MKTYDQIQHKIDLMNCEAIYDGEDVINCHNECLMLLAWVCQTSSFGVHRTPENIAQYKRTLEEELIPYKLNPTARKPLDYFITKNKIRFLEAILEDTEWPKIDIYR